MQTKTIGIILIAFGLLFFALQMEGIYRDGTFLVMGLLGLGLWWKVQRTMGLMALSFVAITLAIAALFELPEFVRMLLLSASFLIPWLVQGIKNKRRWPLIPAILFAVNALASWQGPWLTIQVAGAWAPLAVGLVFIAVYAFTRQLGFLIPGVIMSAIGIFALLPSGPHEDWGFFLGLGLAFLTIWAVHTRTRGTNFGTKFWPLFPAAFFTVFSLALALSQGLAENLFLPIFLGGPALVLLIIYFFKRQMALLIPGLMLASVALWFTLGTETVSPLLFFMAFSFLAILALETRRADAPMERWWPLIPALVLGGNGYMLLLAEKEKFSIFENLGAATLGIIFVCIGILVLLGKDKRSPGN